MRRAFTLVELLVVLSVLALLAGILVPVSAHAKAKGMEAQRLEKLHQLGVGAALYEADYDGVVLGEPGKLVETKIVALDMVDEPLDATPVGYGNFYRGHNGHTAYGFRMSASGFLDGYEPDVAPLVPGLGGFRFILCPQVVNYDALHPNWTPFGRYSVLRFDSSAQSRPVPAQDGHFRFLGLFLP